MKAPRLQRFLDEARGNLIQGIIAGEGEKLSGTHVNSQAFYVEEKEGHVYMAREQNITLIKVTRVGGTERYLFTGGASADPAAKREGWSFEGTNTTGGSG